MWNLKKNYKKEKEQPCAHHFVKQRKIQQNMCLDVEEILDRKQRNIKNNTEEEWEEVVPDIQLEIKQKKKRRQKRESLGRKHSHESFRFGCLVQHYEQ